MPDHFNRDTGNFSAMKRNDLGHVKEMLARTTITRTEWKGFSRAFLEIHIAYVQIKNNKMMDNMYELLLADVAGKDRF